MDRLHQVVWDYLGEGYGAEDIAHKTGHPVATVRRCIQHFRVMPNRLPQLYGRARKKWREECKTPA